MKVNVRTSFYKILVVLICCLCLSSSAYAQILENRGKLRTTKSDRGFVLFGRKIKTRTEKKRVKKTDVKTSYSPGKGRVKKVNRNPGFSAPLFGSRIRRTTPRYSARRSNPGNPNAGKWRTPPKARVSGRNPNARVAPGRSRPVAGLKNSPRYSPASRPGKKTSVNPLFTPRRQGVTSLSSSPRYSPEREKSKRGSVNPRYSPARSGVRPAIPPLYTAYSKRGKKAKVSPRYSEKAGEGAILPYPVRYTAYKKRGKKEVVSPRYSAGKNRGREKIIRKPGFNVFHYLLAIPGGVVLAISSYDERIGEFQGYGKPRSKPDNSKTSAYQGKRKTSLTIVDNYKAKRRARSMSLYSGSFSRESKLQRRQSEKGRAEELHGLIIAVKTNKRRKQMHPSAVRLTVNRRSTKAGKEIVKKVNRFTTKVDGNKAQPPSVRGRKRKLKFDKKEKDIWYE